MSCCGSNCARCPWPNERRLLWMPDCYHKLLVAEARKRGVTVDELAEQIFAEIDGGKS